MYSNVDYEAGLLTHEWQRILMFKLLKCELKYNFQGSPSNANPKIKCIEVACKCNWKWFGYAFVNILRHVEQNASLIYHNSKVICTDINIIHCNATIHTLGIVYYRKNCLWKWIHLSHNECNYTYTGHCLLQKELFVEVDSLVTQWLQLYIHWALFTTERTVCGSGFTCHTMNATIHTLGIVYYRKNCLWKWIHLSHNECNYTYTGHCLLQKELFVEVDSLVTQWMQLYIHWALFTTERTVCGSGFTCHTMIATIHTLGIVYYRKNCLWKWIHLSHNECNYTYTGHCLLQKELFVEVDSLVTQWMQLYIHWALFTTERTVCGSGFTCHTMNATIHTLGIVYYRKNCLWKWIHLSHNDCNYTYTGHCLLQKELFVEVDSLVTQWMQLYIHWALFTTERTVCGSGFTCHTMIATIHTLGIVYYRKNCLWKWIYLSHNECNYTYTGHCLLQKELFVEVDSLVTQWMQLYIHWALFTTERTVCGSGFTCHTMNATIHTLGIVYYRKNCLWKWIHLSHNDCNYTYTGHCLLQKELFVEVDSLVTQWMQLYIHWALFTTERTVCGSGFTCHTMNATIHTLGIVYYRKNCLWKWIHLSHNECNYTYTGHCLLQKELFVEVDSLVTQWLQLYIHWALFTTERTVCGSGFTCHTMNATIHTLGIVYYRKNCLWKWIHLSHNDCNYTYTGHCLLQKELFVEVDSLVTQWMQLYIHWALFTTERTVCGSGFTCHTMIATIHTLGIVYYRKNCLWKWIHLSHNDCNYTYTGHCLLQKELFVEVDSLVTQWMQLYIHWALFTTERTVCGSGFTCHTMIATIHTLGIVYYRKNCLWKWIHLSHNECNYTYTGHCLLQKELFVEVDSLVTQWMQLYIHWALFTTERTVCGSGFTCHTMNATIHTLGIVYYRKNCLWKWIHLSHNDCNYTYTGHCLLQKELFVEVDSLVTQWLQLYIHWALFTTERTVCGSGFTCHTMNATIHTLGIVYYRKNCLWKWIHLSHNECNYTYTGHCLLQKELFVEVDSLVTQWMQLYIHWALFTTERTVCGSGFTCHTMIATIHTLGIVYYRKNCLWKWIHLSHNECNYTYTGHCLLQKELFVEVDSLVTQWLQLYIHWALFTTERTVCGSGFTCHTMNATIHTLGIVYYRKNCLWKWIHLSHNECNYTYTGHCLLQKELFVEVDSLVTQWMQLYIHWALFTTERTVCGSGFTCHTMNATIHTLGIVYYRKNCLWKWIHLSHNDCNYTYTGHCLLQKELFVEVDSLVTQWMQLYIHWALFTTERTVCGSGFTCHTMNATIHTLGIVYYRKNCLWKWIHLSHNDCNYTYTGHCLLQKELFVEVDSLVTQWMQLYIHWALFTTERTVCGSGFTCHTMNATIHTLGIVYYIKNCLWKWIHLSHNDCNYTYTGHCLLQKELFVEVDSLVTQWMQLYIHWALFTTERTVCGSGFTCHTMNATIHTLGIVYYRKNCLWKWIHLSHNECNYTYTGHCLLQKELFVEVDSLVTQWMQLYIHWALFTTERTVCGSGFTCHTMNATIHTLGIVYYRKNCLWKWIHLSHNECNYTYTGHCLLQKELFVEVDSLVTQWMQLCIHWALFTTERTVCGSGFTCHTMIPLPSIF